MRDQITTAVREARIGKGQLRITFKRASTDDTRYLLAMERSGSLNLRDSDKTVMQAVATSRDWSGDANRTLIVTLTSDFNEETFVDRMDRALEKIEVVK